MLTHGVRRTSVGSGTTRYNLLLLAVAALAALVAWTALGEVVGDVYQSEGESGLTALVVFVGSMLYLSLIFDVLFIPGFALFVFLMRKINQRARLSGIRQRVFALLLSPLIAVVFFVIPAVPDDGDDVLSGWWFVLGTAATVALLARFPSAQEQSDG